ncbi:MAG: efflux RND transporter periplasmic adaptor subunit [Proteobacteria bacterium]|nr:efflux RND transporter periplasmic adaptor subunit [Pseudomonadota bacterium]
MRAEPPSLLRTRLRAGFRGAAVLAATLACLAACSKKPDEAAKAHATPAGVTLTAAQRQHIGLYTVEQGAFTRTVEASGVVDFDNDQATSVIAPFSGPVSRILVNPGDRVRKGQPLAIVESADFATAVGAYTKAVAAARTARRLADMDKDLLAHNGVSAREAQQAESDAVGAESDRDAALQALVALGVDSSTIAALKQGRPVARIQGVIRAPISGTVAEKLITPGQLLQAGSTAAFTVADLSRVWVMAQVSDADIAAVRLGDTAEITGDAMPAGMTGVVQNISAVVNPDTRSVIARVVVANPAEVLKKQMYVRVRIRSRLQNSGLIAPVSAILRDDQNLPFVYVAMPDNSYARRSVTLGQRAGDLYAITSGLAGGERVVTNGGIFLQFLQNQ